MINKKGKKFDLRLLIQILPVISVFVVISIKILCKADITDIFKIGIITFLLTQIVALYIRYKSGFNSIRYSNIIFFISYLISILFIMLPDDPSTFSFWMAGGLINAMLIDKILGLLVYLNLAFILSINYSVGPGTIIYFLVMGILFILMSDTLKDRATVIYSAIILLSANIIFKFIINNFLFAQNGYVNYLASFFSIFAVLMAAFLLSILYEKILRSHAEPVSGISKAEKGNNNEESILLSEVKNAVSNYDLLLSEDNELLIRLKNYSENLYRHCRKIGDLSGKAARLIGADENLARAGGYYHEIGKINGNNYIEEGLKLADEYAFPEKLKNIIRQHNIKYDKPTFKESAIVMITDNVTSTIEYINKIGVEKHRADIVIEGIFRMRMEKGTLDESGLTVKEFRILKDFFKNEF